MRRTQTIRGARDLELWLLSLATGGGNKATRVQIRTDTSEEDGGTNNMHEHWRTEDRTRAVRTMAAKEQRGDWL